MIRKFPTRQMENRESLHGHDIIRPGRADVFPPARVCKIPKLQLLSNATHWFCTDIELFVEAGSIRAFRRAKSG